MIKAILLRVFYLALMFVSGLALSNILLPERFGTVSLIILNASLLGILSGLGAESLMLHKVSNNQWTVSKATQFIWYTTAIQLLLFLILEAGSLFYLKKTLLSNETDEYLYIEILYFIGLILTEKQLALLYAYHRAPLANLILAFVGVIYVLFLLMFSIIETADYLFGIYLFAIHSFLQGIILVLLFNLKKPVSISETFKYRELFNALKLSSVVMLTNVIQLLAYRVDFWVIKYYYGNFEVGIYAQANKFANLMWIVPNIIAPLLIPKFPFIGNRDLPKIFSAGFYFNFFSIIATLICTHLFYFYYLNDVYKVGLGSFYLMLPGYFFWATVIYFGAYFSWAGKFVVNLICSTCCFLLIAVMDLVLIPKFGLEGAAWANTVTYFSVFLIYYFILIKKFSFAWYSLILFKRKDLSRISKLLVK